ncbi:MAG: FAD-binding oxidoreductase [Bacteroidetes bacterium HGW-Bacteroidetes-4]|jgi:FAD/FMN-containing dehydrogenase/Fe-S oxidoreductase|nr:MAG: FAD-binding oxidoreductase [Bacteroidetes bacterium HGW-Bacteroidetes-4]
MEYKKHLSTLSGLLEGELLTDEASKIRYASDASVYFEKPAAVVVPKNEHDIEKLVNYAAKHKIPLIPRAAGTSLAGQVVGNGVVVDISKYLTQIIDFNPNEKTITVEPGVILDELNRFLEPHALFFGPETSTANRCNIGGMAGNNACGLHAVVYGTTRDHIMETSGFLSDGSKVTFKPITKTEFDEKCKIQNLEGKIYRQLNQILSDKENQNAIIENYPDQRITRRNHGYAIDQLLFTDLFGKNDEPFNLAKLIAGSEGTLLFMTQIKLALVDLPPKEKGLVAAHFNSVNDALKANIIALKHGVTAVELMDDIILNASKDNLEQQKNRFFVQGNPKALLLIEFAKHKHDEIEKAARPMIDEMKQNMLGYHYPILYGSEIKKAWNLRKAGLGIMANIPGDTKSVTVIEDTAVHPDVLPEYIEEFSKIMAGYGEECVYHAHAGTGEIHLRPRLDLKKEQDIEKFEQLAWDIARLVKKYKGSLSGEHGDGRLRGEFIPFMLGDKVYHLLKELKNTWDPNHIFNPGKIIDTPPMRSNLRAKKGATREIKTYFDFSEKQGLVRAAESCNGSGDCRKLHTAGGTMCPSYMATRDEAHVTRSRANILREFLVNSPKQNPFDHQEIYDALDLCLSCKACKSECPSSVDVAKMKAEFLQHWYKQHGIPLRTRAIANISRINSLGAWIPGITNFVLQHKQMSKFLKKTLGMATERSLPLLSQTTLRNWANKNIPQTSLPIKSSGRLVLFIDEFTNYNDAALGITTIKLLTELGYHIQTFRHVESGRAYLSKGLLISAKKLALLNVSLLKDIISDSNPLVGIEPSAILTFRDEYPDLVGAELKDTAKTLAKNTLTIEEFLAREIEKGTIDKTRFTIEPKQIKLHGHCQQKAIASTQASKTILAFPENYTVEEIPSGCCGMAGSFGYEKEHYQVSMQIGELVLFPSVRNTTKETLIAAPGTSCRHQIKDGTGRQALHPVEILYQALKN